MNLFWRKGLFCKPHARSGLVLQLVAQSTAYNLFPKGGKVQFKKIS